MDNHIGHILERFRENRTEGIQLLFDRYYRPLVLFANEQLKDLPVAEDTIQELFVRLWKDEHLLKVAPEALSIYLYRSVSNACSNIRQRNDTKPRWEPLTNIDMPIEVFSTIEEEKIDLVLKEIEQLSLRSRQAVECVMLKEMKYKDAAAELGISVNTVKFLLKEGMRHLRENVSVKARHILFLILRSYPKN